MNKIYRDTPCPECGNFTNRGISVDAVIIKDKQVLLIKRGVNPFKGFWGIPGGYVGWNETVEETVKREVKEETNLEVTNMWLVGVYSSPQRHPKQVINIVYRVKVENMAFVAADDAVEAGWFAFDDIPEDLAFDHRQNIEDALNQLNENSNSI